MMKLLAILVTVFAFCGFVVSNDDGTYADGTWYQDFGQVEFGDPDENALLFDGVDDYVSLDGLTVDGEVATFTFQIRSHDDESSYFLDFDSQRLVLAWSNSGSVALYDRSNWATFGTTPNDGEWHTVEFRLNGTTAQCFVDDSKLGTDKTIIAIDIDEASAAKMATRNNASGNFIKGQIRYAEIQQNGVTVNKWNFSDGKGTTLTDVVGSNDGAITGAQWVNNDVPEEALTAIHALGEADITFTRTTTDTERATYFDADGVMQVCGADWNNIPRITYGDYGTTGFVSSSNGISHKGFLVEPESTNLISPTTLSVDGGGGVASGWYVADDESNVITYTLNDATDTFNLGTVNSQKAEVTFSDGTYFLFGKTTEVGTVSQNDVVTISAWVKGSSSGLSVRFGMQQLDLNGIAGTTNVGSDFASMISSTEWRRFSHTFTAADADVSKVAGRFLQITGMTAGSAMSLEFACPQVEKGVLPTSFIPTTTVAVTRPADVMTAPTLLNRTANEETCYVGFVPLGGDFASDGGTRAFFDTDTKSRYLAKSSTGTSFYYQPNGNDSGSCLTSLGVSSLANTFYSLATIAKHTSPYASLFLNSFQTGNPETSDDFTNNTWGNNMYIGCNKNSLNQINGIIKYLAFHKTAHSQHEINYWNDYYKSKSNR